jgi:cation transport regulator
MPYATNEDLPEGVKDNLPSGAAAIYKAAFNSAYNGTCKKDDGCAAKIAWSAVKQSYHKDEEGNWVKNQKQHICPGCHINKTESHDAILQLLDRKVGALTFPKEPFIPTVDKWNGIPLVFGKEHPNLYDLLEDPEHELARVNAVIVGELSDARIDVLGHPKLMAKENFSDSTAIRLFEQGKISKDTLEKSRIAVGEAIRLLNAGKLSHSTAFLCPDDGVKLYGEVFPNHHLVFEETATDMPVDLGAVILNKTTATMTAPSVTSTSVTTFNDNTTSGSGYQYYPTTTVPYIPNITVRENELPGGESLNVKLNNTRQDERSKMDEAEKAAILKESGEALAAKEAEITKLQKQVDELLAEKVQMQKAQEDAVWEGLKKEVIPPGFVKSPDDEAALRKLCKEDPLAFNQKVLGAKLAATKAEGSQHANKVMDTETEDKLDQFLKNIPQVPGRNH